MAVSGTEEKKGKYFSSTAIRSEFLSSAGSSIAPGSRMIVWLAVNPTRKSIAVVAPEIFQWRAVEIFYAGEKDGNYSPLPFLGVTPGCYQSTSNLGWLTQLVGLLIN